MPPKLDVVLVRTITALEHQYQFMLRLVKTTLTYISFDPDNHVLKFAINLLTGDENFRQVAPINADVVDGAFVRLMRGEGESTFEESGEFIA